MTANASFTREDVGGTKILLTDVAATGLDVQSFIDPAKAEKFLLTGTLHATVTELQGQRDGYPSLFAGLNGDIQLTIEDGVVKRSRVLAAIFSVMNLHKTLRPGFPDLKSKGLKFNSIKGTWSLHDGVFSTTDLVLESNAVRIEAVGAVNMLERRFEGVNGNNGMRVVVQPFYSVDNIISQISKLPFVTYVTGENLTLLGAFFDVSGPLSDPSVRPVDVRSLEAGPRERLKKTLQGGLRLFKLLQKKEE